MSRLALVVLLVLTAAPAAWAAPWRPPAGRPEVLRAFRFDPGAPYTPHGRRGVRLAVRPGATVRAVCDGRVRFAGRVPGLGRGVTLRCGRLLATEFGLRAALVRRGAVVRRGDRLGDAAAPGIVWLGARRAGARQGYVDPLALLGGDPATIGPAPAPAPGRARRPVPPPATRLPAARPSAASLPPAAAWAGALAACVALGLGRRRARTARRGRVRAARGAARANH